ncbi:hypothetical protein AW736_04515 [Termitidicoccus mucosus]|uniref:Uncharacterized protein n=1 Tax=Termitidicoccus mucosus TaxID=1184151 RepID=A0A178IMZ6_9BACT|nr:hypothetical protein AW736_04515 [Opitutaceae bacterium TSB47]
MMPPPGARAPRPQTTRTGLPPPLQKDAQRRQPPFRIAEKPRPAGGQPAEKSAPSTRDNTYGKPKKTSGQK